MNFIVIMADSLRADYAYNTELMPGLNEFADEYCIKYTRAYTAAPWTLASNLSVLSGSLPQKHGVVDLSRNIMGLSKMLELYRPKFTEQDWNEFWLPSLLQSSGHYCFAKTGGGYLISGFGFNRGFSYFEGWPWVWLDLEAWVDAFDDCGMDGFRNKKPWFFFSQDFDTHEPFGPFPRESAFKEQSEKGELSKYRLFTSCDKEASDFDFLRWKHYYRESCFQYDNKLRAIFKFIEKRGRMNDTAIFFLSDHGEQLGDGGGFGGHGVTLHEKVLNVPLLVHWPGVEPGVCENVVSTIDICATILGKSRHSDSVSLFGGDRKYAFSEVRREIYDSELPTCKRQNLGPYVRQRSAVCQDFQLLHGNSDLGQTEIVVPYEGHDLEEAAIDVARAALEEAVPWESS